MPRTSVCSERKDSAYSYSLQNMQYTRRNACVYTFFFIGILKSQNESAAGVNIDNVQTTGSFQEHGKKRAKQNAQTSLKAAVS